MATDNNDFTHEFQIYSTDLNAGTIGTGKFLLFDNNINALKVEDISNLQIGGGEEGQVIMTDGSGNLIWATSSGGGTSVNADWNSSSGASRILNKPDLTAYLPKSGGTLTGKINAAQGAGTAGGYSFGGTEGGNDTGMFSNADGVLDFYANAVKIVTVTTGGVTSTQAITLPGNPTSNLQASTKQYVDSAVNALNNFSGNYNDLTNKPTVATSAYIGTTLVSFDRASGSLTLNGVSIDGNAATVSNGVYTNGSYSNPAWITSLAYAKLTGAPSLASVATSGSYSDLTNKPALATVATSGSYSDLTNRPNIFSGSYTDLTNKPTLFDGAYLSLTGLPNLAAVATSGSYDDLSNKPSIPTLVNADWNETISESPAYIFNKPTIPSLDGYATEAWVNEQGFGSGGSVNLGNITFDNDNIGSTNNVVNILASDYAQLESNGNYLWVDNTGLHLEVNTGEGGNTFVFEHDTGVSRLRLPGGGDIVDSNGVSVLGGSAGPTNQITNTDGYNTWAVSVATTGVITMDTGRGSIEFGAQPEVGAPNHLHIMRPAGQEGSNDLFFGDDYNYVRLPANYGPGSQGVEIGSSVDNGTVSVWRFGTDGKLALPEGGTGGTGGITFPDGTVQTTAYVTSVQKGFFTEFKHNGDNNRVDMEAVAVDNAGNSYVSYSYYSDNDSRRYGGIVKLSSSGAVQWTKDITSPSGNPDYVKIVSLEFVTINNTGSFLTAYGYYYDNNTNRDVGLNYFLDPETGDINSNFSTELNVNYATELSDGVFGEENGGPVSVFAGKTYGANLEKQFTILSPSTTDRIYISWEEYAASGLNPGDQLYYYVGGYYGMYVNKFDCTAVAPGASSPWDGLSLQVSVSKNGSNYSYSILRTNGWSGAIYSWSSPQSVTVPGSQLGGTDGVNDLTFDFDPSIFNNDSNNVLAAISNVQGTPYSDAVVCPAWNGKDWSTEIGNTLTFEYQLSNQALLTKIGGSGNWTKNLGGTDSEQFESVTVDSSNNIYAVGYYWKTNKGSFVTKYDSSGNEQWAVLIDPSGNTGNTVHSVDLLSDGNIITVADDGIVTKIDSSDGSIMWQIMNDGGPSWDSEFKGTATPDGNYIFANYEDNDYTMYVICVSGTDGSILWTKQISRNFAGSNGEIYPQNDYSAQYIDCNSTQVVIGATSEIYLNNNTTYSGVVISLPIDGQDIDGNYGQYVIQSVSLNWNTQSTTSTAIAVDIQTIGADTTGVTPNTSNPDFTVTKTSIGGGAETTTPVAGIERHSASSGDNNLTLAEEHNGKFLYYNGSNGNSWIYVPSDNDVNLPIGFTVTVVMDEFNGNYIYVNNNTGSQNATINASGFDYNQTNYWKFGQDGKSGVYTIMKVDTDRWMLAGPDITTD